MLKQTNQGTPLRALQPALPFPPLRRGRVVHAIARYNCRTHLGAVRVAFASAASAEDTTLPGQDFAKSYQAAITQAQEQCVALFADHVFDSLRTKIPLNGGKPTFAMLTNTEKVRPKDKALAALAVKTMEKCRVGWEPVLAMLPSQMNSLIQNLYRKQDAFIAELSTGKINFGEYNVAVDKIIGEAAEIISGVTPSTPNPNQPTSRTVPSATSPPGPAVASHATPPVAQFHGLRLALVVGNSNYANLPKLSNPTNDARAVADVLQKLGYKTQLLLDASEQTIRTQIRRFAAESSNAEVAIVYYAGHGAQLGSSNYLLPVDIDIPKTEADIQFAGLKVDDLVNSISSNTKIVFLDACRDNPALFKNIVVGRGSGPIGLAPATVSNFNQKPGGGVFIAYATDAGAVADDGHGQHSPFTQALLRYMQNPISIDDMFSLVTREVRLVSKNAQRPYKYASLENIVCLTPVCSGTPIVNSGDVVQQAKQSEEEDLQSALRTNNVAALDTFLRKYPDTSKSTDILNAVASLKRAEMTEWTLFEIGDKHNPQYMQLSSIQRFGDRAAVRMKSLVDETKPKVFFNRPFPDAAYSEDLNVYDCTAPRMVVAEDSIFNKSGQLLYHYKFGDPQYVNFAIGVPLSPGSVGSSASYIVCHDAIGTPSVSKEQLAAMKFHSLQTLADGGGELFSELVQRSHYEKDQREALLIGRYFADRSIMKLLSAGFLNSGSAQLPF